MDEKSKNLIIDKIIQEINKKEKIIIKANEIDKIHYKNKININRFIQIAESMKEKNIGKFKEKNLVVTHNGNPYITFILAIKAICSNTNIEICINETMLGVNSVIIKIIETLLEELKINIKLQILNMINIKELKNKQNYKIIVLQDKAQYSFLLKNQIKNVVYKPIYNVTLYIDDNEFEDIKQDIIQYCDENFIEIEIYDAEDIEDAIEQFTADNEGEYALILTRKNVDINKIKKLKETQNIEIFVNKNILTDLEERIIESEL